MPKFRVQVCREIHEYRTYEIEQDTLQKAREAAITEDSEETSDIAKGEPEIRSCADVIVTWNEEIKDG